MAMWRVPLICTMLLSVCVVLTRLPDAAAQRRQYYGGRLNTQQLVRRIDELERRVAALEGNRPAKPRVTISMSVERAEQYVAETQARFEFSEKMLAKGYVSQAEYDADRHAFRRAEKVLQLATATRDEQPTDDIVAKIEVLDAEYDLNVAKLQLNLVEKYAAGGFAGRAGLEGHRKAVEEAQLRLDRARGHGEEITP
jgi:hypothetical protein